MNSITITKTQLQSALQAWEQAHRNGECQAPEEVAAKTVEQVAAESADGLWAALSEPCVEFSPLESSEVRRVAL